MKNSITKASKSSSSKPMKLYKQTITNDDKFEKRKTNSKNSNIILINIP